jgi:hypothetical protein
MVTNHPTAMPSKNDTRSKVIAKCNVQALLHAKPPGVKRHRFIDRLGSDQLTETL